MFCCQDALVAELVDAHASGACGRSPVEVQVLFRAPTNISSSFFEGLFLFKKLSDCGAEKIINLRLILSKVSAFYSL